MKLKTSTEMFETIWHRNCQRSTWNENFVFVHNRRSSRLGDNAIWFRHLGFYGRVWERNLHRSAHFVHWKGWKGFEIGWRFVRRWEMYNMEPKWSAGDKIGGENLPEGAEKMGVLVLEEWAGKYTTEKESLSVRIWRFNLIREDLETWSFLFWNIFYNYFFSTSKWQIFRSFKSIFIELLKSFLE